MTKKLISVRLQQGTLNQIKHIQKHLESQGFKLSQADIIQDSIQQLYNKTIEKEGNTQ